MGTYNVDKCIFTGLLIEDCPSQVEAIEYYLTINSNRILIRLHPSAEEWEESEPFFKENKYLFHALLMQNKWFEQKYPIIVTIGDLEELIAKRDFPRTPQQKTEYLFHALYKLQKEDGEMVNVRKWSETERWRIFYFKSDSEMVFYFQHLVSEELITADYIPNKRGFQTVSNYRLTYKGLQHAIQLESEGEKSKKCFIAMSFNSSSRSTREAIRAALIATGYEPVIIDEQIIDSERTINDEIIASLKKCKFCIADFSFHSNGVYFESGFALGHGKKVIYTCSSSEFGKAHFDIKPLQHIIYETPEQLTKELVHKIEAYIN